MRKSGRTVLDSRTGCKMQQSNKEEAPNTDQAITLHSAHDIKVYYSLDPENNIRGRLQGIITRVHTRGSIIFYKLFDGTDSIQMIANRTRFPETVWESI